MAFSIPLVQQHNGFSFLLLAWLAIPALHGAQEGGSVPVTARFAAALEDDPKITLRIEHRPLREVLDQIGKLADVRFLYEAGVVDPVKDVSVDCRDQPLYPTLVNLLRPHGLTCVVAMQGQLVITRLHEGPAEQMGSLKGVVRSKAGELLVGATVLLKEAKRGAATNAAGEFIIKGIRPGTYTVRVNYISYSSAQKAITIRGDETVSEDFVLESNVINIGGIEVQAETDLLQRAAETKTEISSAEIKHMQASNVGDVLNLVPGVQKTENPGLGKLSQVAIRGEQSNNLSSFGTLVIVDGVPLSNNANLQFERSSDATTGPSNLGSGADLRTVPAENVESIEVIRGLPSVRYGDATAGVINIRTRTGSQPNRLSLKNNPDTREGNLGGGFSWSGMQFSYNLNAAQSERDIRKTGDEFTRLTGQLVLGKRYLGDKLSTNHKFYGQRIFDEEQPKGDVYQTQNYNRGYTLGYTTWGEYKPDNLSELDYNAFVTYRRENSMKSRLIQSDLRILPTGDTVSTYMGKVESRGAEWTIGGRIEWQSSLMTGKLFHRTLVGADLQYNANAGEGVLVDSLYNYYGPESGKRSYRFDDIPGQTIASLYLEDRITGNLFFPFTFTPGFRYEMYRPFDLRLKGLFGEGDFARSHQGTFFNPRMNLTLYLTSDAQLRLSAGSSSKSPAMSYIYPPPEVLLWRNPADRSIVYFRLDERAPDLKGYKEFQYEAALDNRLFDLVGTSLSCYYKHRAHEPAQQSYPIFYTAYLSGKPTVYYLGYYQAYENLNATISKGIEFSLRTTRVSSLNMEFRVAGSYNHNSYIRNGWGLNVNPDPADGEFPNYHVPNVPVDTIIGFYYRNAHRWRDLLLINYQVGYIVPPLGLWISVRAEQNIFERDQETNLHPVVWEAMTEKTRADRLYDESVKTKPVKWLWSINISKSLSSGSEISFYVNNFLDDPALWRHWVYSDLWETQRNPSLFYGIEMSLLIDSLWE